MPTPTKKRKMNKLKLDKLNTSSEIEDLNTSSEIEDLDEHTDSEPEIWLSTTYNKNNKYTFFLYKQLSCLALSLKFGQKISNC